MFDYIKIKVKCPVCGEISKIDDFQSKDNGCSLGHLEYWEVDNFYHSCDKCGAWLSFNIKKNVRQALPISAYTLQVRTKDGSEEYNSVDYIV